MSKLFKLNLKKSTWSQAIGSKNLPDLWVIKVYTLSTGKSFFPLQLGLLVLEDNTAYFQLGPAAFQVYIIFQAKLTLFATFVPMFP